MRFYLILFIYIKALSGIGKPIVPTGSVAPGGLPAGSATAGGAGQGSVINGVATATGTGIAQAAPG